MKDGERFKIGHDENTQWLKIVRIADTDFFPKYTLKINDEKVYFGPVLTEIHYTTVGLILPILFWQYTYVFEYWDSQSKVIAS